MKRILFGLLLGLAAFGQVQVISDTLTNAAGATPYTGRIVAELSGPGSAGPLYYGVTSLTGWRMTYCIGVTGSDCNVTSAAGVFVASLYANTTMVPATTSYSARYTPAPGRGSAWSEVWQVEPGDTLVKNIRIPSTPTPNIMIQASQIISGGASSGQCLKWNGSSYAPASCGGGGSGSTWDELSGVTWDELQ